jgi:hypothetical protein
MRSGKKGRPRSSKLAVSPDVLPACSLLWSKMKRTKSKKAIGSTRKVETDCLQWGCSIQWKRFEPHPPSPSGLQKLSGRIRHWPVPNYLSDFTQVFAKESFDALPEPWPWDHTIELVPGEKPSGCKVNSLSPSEKRELDAFLKENLESRRIRPYKVPDGFPSLLHQKEGWRP